ncbi:MAG: hypothetical protein ACLR01_14620 [Vescimonas sp.]
MEIKMTEKQFRRLLDLVYIGNWILNSTRGDDRIRQYDEVESLVFSQCLAHGMAPLTELYQGQLIPSQAFAEGGIHEAIMAYEDTTFFEILAQELALRDMDDPPITEENYDEVMNRMNAYLGSSRPTAPTTSPWTWNNALHKKSAGRALPADFYHRHRSADEEPGTEAPSPAILVFVTPQRFSTSRRWWQRPCRRRCTA